MKLMLQTFCVTLHFSYSLQVSSSCNDLYDHANCNLLPDDNECGTVSQSPRIIGGNDAALGEFPWIAILYFTNMSSTAKPEPKCGGAIITRGCVLTAAHCAHPPHPLNISHVRVGEHDLSCTMNRSAVAVCATDPKDFFIRDIIVHEGYDKHSHNDIALLYLVSPIDFNLYIAPICLPMAQLFQSDEYQTNTKMQVAGWGITDISTMEMATVLQTVSLPIVPLIKCQRSYPHRYTNEKQLCVGGVEDEDSCNGDSGGPLMGLFSVNERAERYFQVGITSFGTHHCGLGSPAVYTKVPLFIRWILDNLDM